MRSRNRQNYEKYGDLFFITSTIVGFIDLFDSRECCNIMLDSLKSCQSRGDFWMIGYVIMPNHFHLLVKTKPESNISKIIGNIKRYTSHQIVSYLEDSCQTGLLKLLAMAASKEPAEDCRIWKPRFDCFVITNEDTLVQKLEYLHFNPVRRGLVDDPIKWRCSSARNYAGLSDVDLDVDIHWTCLGYRTVPSGGTPDGALKFGVSGVATGALGSTGAFGLAKQGMVGRLGFQAITSATHSIGNNIASGMDHPFNGFTMGLGPVTFRFGKHDKLLNYRDNAMTIWHNAVGLASVMLGDDVSIGWDWKSLSPNYKGGFVGSVLGPYSYGAFAIYDSPPEMMRHEGAHIWQSRAMGELFYPTYFHCGISAMVDGGHFHHDNWWEYMADQF